MPVNIFDLHEDRKTVHIEKYDLNVTYRPNELTPARELAILRASGQAPEGDDEDETDFIAEVQQAERNIERQMVSMEALVEAWDFLGPLARTTTGEYLPIPRDQAERAVEYVEERGGTVMVHPGAPVPVKAECLVLLGSFFLTEVLRHINEDMRPPKTRKRR